jgi:hypothetical protein
MSARPATPEHLRTARAELAARVRELDRELAALAPDAGPWIVLRDDGAVFTGRRYAHDRDPMAYAYKWAAEKRATLDGTAVWPLAVWIASKQTETEETR